MSGSRSLRTESPASRSRLTPALRATVAWHAALLGAGMIAPGAWRWWLGGMLLNHLGMTAAGMWPRSRLLGPNLTRLPKAAVAMRQVAITIDDGPDPRVTPAVLDILARAGARASFFCIGEKVRRHPDLVRRMIEAGHRIENHSQRHLLYFAMLGPGGIRRELSNGQATIADATGRAPRFFRAPAGLRNPLLEPVLAECGLRLASWTRRGYDTVWRDPAGVGARLARGLGAGDILLLHDGNAARDRAGVPLVQTVLPNLLEQIHAAGLRCVTLDEAA